MKTKTKKKLCWNCEGEAALTAVQCPFCGVNLEGEEASQKEQEDFAPPYKLTENSQIPNSPYTLAKEKNEEEEDPQEKKSIAKSHILSIVFSLVGAAFALFGIVLWLFADQTGHLHLRWNAQYWFFYLLISLPLLYLGWKGSQSTQDDN